MARSAFTIADLGEVFPAYAKAEEDYSTPPGLAFTSGARVRRSVSPRAQASKLRRLGNYWPHSSA